MCRRASMPVISSSASVSSSGEYSGSPGSVSAIGSSRSNESWGTSNVCAGDLRSEEHTSELQSRLHLVCRLLLEKKKNKKQQIRHTKQNQKKNYTQQNNLNIYHKLQPLYLISHNYRLLYSYRLLISCPLLGSLAT